MKKIFDSLSGQWVEVRDITPAEKEEGYPPARTKPEFDRIVGTDYASGESYTVATCTRCGSNWKYTEKRRTCPLCGLGITTDNLKATLAYVKEEIYWAYGIPRDRL